MPWFIEIGQRPMARHEHVGLHADRVAAMSAISRPTLASDRLSTKCRVWCGHADAVEGIDGLVQPTHAGHVGGGHEHQVGGVVHHRQRALAETGVGVDDHEAELVGSMVTALVNAWAVISSATPGTSGAQRANSPDRCGVRWTLTSVTSWRPPAMASRTLDSARRRRALPTSPNWRSASTSDDLLRVPAWPGRRPGWWRWWSCRRRPWAT